MRSQDLAAPQQLVSVLRIIEREERSVNSSRNRLRIDQYFRDRCTALGNFVPPGRPREWRKKTFAVLEHTVRQRVEGNQFEDRNINKQWLARFVGNALFEG